MVHSRLSSFRSFSIGFLGPVPSPHCIPDAFASVVVIARWLCASFNCDLHSLLVISEEEEEEAVEAVEAGKQDIKTADKNLTFDCAAFTKRHSVAVLSQLALSFLSSSAVAAVPFQTTLERFSGISDLICIHLN